MLKTEEYLTMIVLDQNERLEQTTELKKIEHIRRNTKNIARQSLVPPQKDSVFGRSPMYVNAISTQ